MSEADWRASRLKRIEVAAIAAIGYPVLAALGRTFCWRDEGAEHIQSVLASGRQPTLALWHGRILAATIYFRDRGIVAITSQNFDGEWTALIMRRFGYLQARGSTSRGGGKALLQLSRDMAEGRTAAFTVDGPRGPARVADPRRLRWPALDVVHAAALRADLLLLGHLVLDGPGDELALLLRVLSPGLQRLQPLRLGARRIADLLRDGRHLLRPLAEDVALQLLDGGLDGGELLEGLGVLSAQLSELDLKGLRPLAPRTVMVVAAH